MTDKERVLQDSVYDRILNGSQATKPTYAGSFEGQLADIYDKIQNREKFSYDVNADPLYEQYKDKYVQQGKMAMRDTMGKAAALTGGYGSSYGQQVGQQTYDAYLQNLSDVIPQLYGAAYDRYRDEGDDLLKQYGMMQDLRDTEYGRYRDALSDYNRQQDLAISREREDYSRQRDEQAYQQQRYSNLYALIKATGYVPTDAELAAAGMTREGAQAIASEYQRGVNMDERTMALKEMSAAGSGGSGGGSGGGGGRSGGGGGSYGSTSYGYTPSGGSLADWWNSASAQGYSDDVLYKTLEKVYGDGNYGPEGDTMATPTTDAGKARLEKLKQRMKG